LKFSGSDQSAVDNKITYKLDSMCWFSHRHRNGRWHNSRPWWPLPKNATLFHFLLLMTLTFDLWLTFELGRDFCTLHLTAKFRHPTFNRLEVIVFTDKLTNKQTDKQTNRCRWKQPPRSTMLCRWVISHVKQKETATYCYYLLIARNLLLLLLVFVSAYVRAYHSLCFMSGPKSSKCNLCRLLHKHVYGLEDERLS